MVDAALYNEAFAGWAKIIPRCRYCLADTHSSQDCLHAPLGNSVGTSGGGHFVEARTGRIPPRQAGQTNRPASVDLCRLFNASGGSRCRFPQCRYAHVCAKCRRPHPAAECSEKRPQAAVTHAGPGSSSASPPPLVSA